MINFCFLLKTYRNDYERAAKFILSYEKYNVDKIPLFILCPKEDINLFEKLHKEHIAIISEESLQTQIFTESNMLSIGYLNQEIYKLAFWETGLCKNYMCIDSDAIFIRPFYLQEFMYDDETPYTQLEEDNDLKADLYYNKLYWNGRREWIRKIENEIDYHPQHLLTCHGFQIFSAKVLKSLKEDFMMKKGYDYKDLIQISPYEFSWYNLWLQKTTPIQIHQIENLFKCFHLKQHHIEAVLSGMKIEDWSKGYVGIIVNSNYGLGNGEYSDLSIYNIANVDIPDEIIDLNYTFYRNLELQKIKRKIDTLIRKMIRLLKRNGNV